MLFLFIIIFFLLVFNSLMGIFVGSYKKKLGILNCGPFKHNKKKTNMQKSKFNIFSMLKDYVWDTFVCLLWGANVRDEKLLIFLLFLGIWCLFENRYRYLHISNTFDNREVDMTLFSNWKLYKCLSLSWDVPAKVSLNNSFISNATYGLLE